MSDALKAEVERKANELIGTGLTPKYVQPPPKNPKFNYVTGLSTKWHGRYFYLVATYACPFPDALSPSFEVNFARLEHLVGPMRNGPACVGFIARWVSGRGMQRCSLVWIARVRAPDAEAADEADGVTDRYRLTGKRVGAGLGRLAGACGIGWSWRTSTEGPCGCPPGCEI